MTNFDVSPGVTPDAVIPSAKRLPIARMLNPTKKGFLLLSLSDKTPSDGSVKNNISVVRITGIVTQRSEAFRSFINHKEK